MGGRLVINLVFGLAGTGILLHEEYRGRTLGEMPPLRFGAVLVCYLVALA